MSWVERADLSEANPAVIREQKVALVNEHNSPLNQLEALQQEVSSLHGKAEAMMRQLYFRKRAAHRWHLKPDNKLKKIASLKTKLQSAESDFIAAVEELDEQKERSRSLLEQQRNPQNTVANPHRQLKCRDNITKKGDDLSLFQQLILPNDAPKDPKTKSSWQLILLYNQDQGGIQEAFVRQQRAHRVLADPDARKVFELERCETAEDVLSFKNNIEQRTLLLLECQQKNNSLAGPSFYLVFLFAAVKLTSVSERNIIGYLEKLFW